jgi:hypothetical protein
MPHLKSRKSRRGGNVGSTVDYGSASNWMIDTVGLGNKQYSDVFDIGSKTPGNAIISVNGKNHAGGSKKKRRGGNWGQVINQAVVPFGLLGIQQSYKRKGKGGRKTRRHRRKHSRRH